MTSFGHKAGGDTAKGTNNILISVYLVHIANHFLRFLLRVSARLQPWIEGVAGVKRVAENGVKPRVAGACVA